jgi:hypothetical protein
VKKKILNKTLCALAPLRALRETKNINKTLCALAPLRALRETKNIAY